MASFSEHEADAAITRLFGETADSKQGSLFSGDGGGDTVKVCARIRPMSALELSKDPTQAVFEQETSGVVARVRPEGDRTFPS